MESFDNLKGKLRDEGSLPEGFGWDDMQEGIFEKMPDTNIPEKELKGFGYWRLTFFLFGMIAMLGLTVLFRLVTNPEETVINQGESLIALSPLNSEKKSFEKKIRPLKEVTENKFSNPEKSTEISADTDRNYSTEIITKPVDKSSSIANKQVIAIANTILHKERKTKVNKQTNNMESSNSHIKTQLPIKNKEIIPPKKIATANQENNISPNIKGVGQEIKPAPLTAFKNNSTPFKTIISSISSQKEKTIWTLSALEKKPLKTLKYLHLPTINPSSLGNPLVVEKRDNQPRFSMAMGAGVNYWTPNWGNTSASQERATYEKRLVGSTYSLQLGYQLKPNWVLSSGIVWSTNYSKFDYEQRDTYQKVKTAALVEIQVNTFTGDSTQIYGNQTVNVARTRKIIHYNSFQKWAIPVSIKYRVQNRKMEYAFGLGTMLTLTTQTAGKTFHQTITDYNAANPIYKTGFEIGAMGSFDLNYHFSNKYFIGAQLSVVKSFGNWSQVAAVVLKPTVFHSQLRIGVKF